MMMVPQYLLALAAITSVAVAAPLEERGPFEGIDNLDVFDSIEERTPLEERAVTCYSGIYVLAARGTDNGHPNASETDPDYKSIGGLRGIATQLMNKAGAANSFLQPLPYPAAPGPVEQYTASISSGVTTAQTMIKNYVNACKGTVTPRIVLLGYSQGAHVMTATLAGDNNHPNIDAFKQYITTGAFFAGTNFRSGVEPIDAGNATTNSILPANPTNYAYLNTNYGNKVREYCEAGDRYCASGVDVGLKIHHSEVQTYTQDALDFMLPKV